MWIDKNLNWSEHLNKLILKLKRNMNLLKISKNLLTPHVKRTVYYAHFHSHLKYGIAVWGHMASKAQLTKLQKIQNECLWLITSTTHTNHGFYKTLGILKIDAITHLETSKLMYRSLKGELPKMLTDAIRTDSNHQSLNKSHTYSTRKLAWYHLREWY